MLNRIDIMGKLVADPEMRFTGGGIPVCTFRIACERDFAAAGAQKETDFIDCVTWREKAEFVNKYFSKGMPILVSGRLQMRRWEDREGNKRTTAEILAEFVYFAGGEKRGGKPAATADEYGRLGLGSEEESLPF